MHALSSGTATTSRAPRLLGAVFAALTASASLLGFSPTAAHATALIAGETGAFEVDYLRFIVDHHYSGLRATELGAGTGTVGLTPGFAPTPGKGTNEVVLDISVRNNMTQEMEIAEAQDFLFDWYGQTAELNLRPSGEELITILDAASPGDPFNIAFLTSFSMHHIMAITRSLECVAEAGHAQLRDYCGNIVRSQTADAREMRAELCDVYGVCRFDTPIPVAVSEPATFALLLAGIAGLGLMCRRNPAGVPPSARGCTR